MSKLEEAYNQAMVHGKGVACPECSLIQNYKTLKRHLVKVHSWRYTDSSPNFPLKVEGELNV